MQPIIMFAKQRSGTRVLGNLLHDNQLVTDFSEVSLYKEKAQLQKRGNLTQFLIECDDKTLIAPSKRGDMIKRYFHYLNQYSQGKPFLLDIKYNQTHNFCDRMPLLEKPRVFHFFKQFKPKYIHLVREKIVQSLISADLLKLTGKSHFTYSVNENRLVTIDVNKLINRIQVRQTEISMFRRYLEDENNIEINYESLFTDEGNFSPLTINKLCSHLSCDFPTDLVPKFKKSGKKDVLSQVNNKEEVLTALRTEGFLHML